MNAGIRSAFVSARRASANASALSTRPELRGKRPPYRPELNRIEILWKHVKYFRRRFATVNGGPVSRDSVPDERFRQRIHGKFGRVLRSSKILKYR
jgi:hypothetical protein